MFSIRLKELRKKANLTQIEFAKRFNIANGTVGNWESGNRQPDYKTLNEIANFFNVSVDYLLGRSDKQYSNPLDEQLSGIDFALWSETQDMSDAEKQDIIDYIQFRKTKRNEKEVLIKGDKIL